MRTRSTRLSSSRTAYHHLPPQKRVLVALMNNPRDLKIAREQHWYRIPVKSAPRGMDAARLAFYQTSAFKEEKWAVRYFAEVQQCTIVKRKQLLPDEAQHPRAENDYYKLELGALQTLEKPIISQHGRRLVFISTTLEKFRRARELNDLFHESPLEDDFWKEIKRRGLEAERQLFVSINKNTYCLDFAVFCRNGQINVECDGDYWHTQRDAIVSDNVRDNALTSSGWAVLRFGTKQIRHELGECLESLWRTILRQGGLDDGERAAFLRGEQRAQLSTL
jgi:very-short-patch-repair endonuclease